jgi:nitroreductase
MKVNVVMLSFAHCNASLTMKYDINQINSLIRNRRSVFPKMYNGEQVPREVIEKMLENANWAPTHKFTEPWRFTVFYAEGVEKFAEFQSELYRKRAGDHRNFDESTYQKLKEKPLMASCIIAIGMKRDPEKRIPEIEEIAAVSCAVQNMYLPATAYGAGCYWSTGGPTFWDEAKVFFKLAQEDKLLGFLYVGMPVEREFGSNRGAWEDKVIWI